MLLLVKVFGRGVSRVFIHYVWVGTWRSLSCASSWGLSALHSLLFPSVFVNDVMVWLSLCCCSLLSVLVPSVFLCFQRLYFLSYWLVGDFLGSSFTLSFLLPPKVCGPPICAGFQASSLTIATFLFSHSLCLSPPPPSWYTSCDTSF